MFFLNSPLLLFILYPAHPLIYLILRLRHLIVLVMLSQFCLSHLPQLTLFARVYGSTLDMYTTLPSELINVESMLKNSDVYHLYGREFLLEK